MSHKAWGNKEEKIRLWYLLHEALTETTSAQPIVLSYPQPNSMLSPQDINHNTNPVIPILSSYCLIIPLLLFHLHLLSTSILSSLLFLLTISSFFPYYYCYSLIFYTSTGFFNLSSLNKIAVYFLEQNHNIDTSQWGFPVKIYTKRPLYKLFFISHLINITIIIKSTKKLVVIYIIGDEVIIN